MSRRNRHKKKKLKAQKKISHFAPVAEAPIETADDAEEAHVGKELRSEKAPKEIEEDDSIIDASTRKFIAKDVKMILFTLLGLAIILTTVKILQLKTGYIDSFGDWLYKIANIQTT